MEKTNLFLPLPTTTTQEVLYTLIDQGHVSIMDFPYLSGFRTRVSNLRKMGLELNTVFLERSNKFGRKYNYALHRLIDKEKALKLYHSMVNINEKTKERKITNH